MLLRRGAAGRERQGCSPGCRSSCSRSSCSRSSCSRSSCSCSTKAVPQAAAVGPRTRGDAALLRGATAEAGGDAWEAQDRPHPGSGSSSLATGAQSEAQPVGGRLRCLPRAKKLLAGGVASPGVGGAPRLAEPGGGAQWPRAGPCALRRRWNPRLLAGAAVRTLAGTPATSAARRAQTSRLCEQGLSTLLLQSVPMAGNKGRGRSTYTFNIEAVGFSRGDKLPDVVLKPPPLFPDTDYKPVPLKTGEDEDYMLALKQELRETVKRMPYFIETPEEKQDDIERYSKRYMKIYKEEWIPDWRRLPREIMPRKKRKKVDPKSKTAKAADRGPSLTNSADVLKKIEELEQRGDGERSDEEIEEKEGSKEKNKDGDGEDNDDDDAEQEEYDEEEQEEENDYINSYFEDGDDFGADSDDNMDEATY